MVTRTRAKKKIVEVPRLRHDGENWLDYRTELFQAVETQGLLGLLDGTSTKPNEPWNPRRIAAWLRDDTEAQYLLATTTPSPIWDHFTISTAHDMLTHLENLFEKDSTATTVVVHGVRSNDSARVAAYTAGTPEDHTRTQCAANDEVRSTNRVEACRLGRQWESSPSNGARRERERTTMNHGKVETRGRGGEKGAKSRGRVGEQEVAARRPGSRATDETTSGVSLATPASGPTPRDDKVVLTEEPRVESQPPEGQSEATSQVRTPPSEDASDGEAQGATGEEAEGGEKDDDEPRRA